MLDSDAAGRLLEWWDNERRDLPWRKTRAPYSVWVSEIMLQQTVVDAVIPHFLRWMTVYPSVSKLARASEEEVTRLWEGLGYYSRARHLRAAAAEVCRSFGGELPRTYAGLRSLPGIGDYTARALLSIAWGEPVAAIEANVRRIVQRLAAWTDWSPARGREALGGLEQVMPRQRPGDFNEALMELGQRLCLSRSPRCALCPLASGCRARADGAVEQIPARRRARTTALSSRLLIALRGDQVLLVRSKDGLFKGLWTFPRLKSDLPPAAATPVARLAKRTHAYTRYRERLAPEVYHFSETEPDGLEDGLWTPIAALDSLPMPSVYRRIARELTDSINRT